MSNLSASEERLLKVIFGDKITKTHKAVKEEKTMMNEFVVIAEFCTAFSGNAADDVRTIRRIGPCSKQEAEVLREQLEKRFRYPGCMSSKNYQKTLDDIGKLYAHFGGGDPTESVTVDFSVEEVFHCDLTNIGAFLAQKGGE